MGLFDWGKSELEDLGLISPGPATSQGIDNSLGQIASNGQTGVDDLTATVVNNSHDGAQQGLDVMDGQAITGPIDAEIAADPQGKISPPPNYWHTEDNPYYTQ